VSKRAAAAVHAAAAYADAKCSLKDHQKLFVCKDSQSTPAAAVAKAWHRPAPALDGASLEPVSMCARTCTRVTRTHWQTREHTGRHKNTLADTRRE
jgi:hypothetical protein